MRGVRGAFASLATLLGLLAPVCGYVRIPQRPPGFTLGHGAASAGVQLEAYVDLLCPFSKAAYSGLKQVAGYYDPQDLRVVLVLFPLPYHQHAFAVAEAAFAITSLLGDDKFTQWVETVYAHQERFWNKATRNRTAVEVVGELHELALGSFPALPTDGWDALMPGYGGTDADFQARAAWDYSAARGEAGTPSYVLNGVPYSLADSSWDFQDWFRALDPLVQANRQPSSAGIGSA